MDTSAPLSTSKLPPIKNLFADSWNLMVSQLLNLLFLSIGAIAATVGLIIAFAAVGLVLALALGLFKAVNNPAALIGSAPLIVVLSVLFLAGMFSSVFIVSMLFTIAPMRLLAGEKKTMGLFALLKGGGKFILPLVAVSFMTVLFVLGGVWLVIVPGLFISMFLAFAQYEVVLAGKRGMSALKGSVRIMTQNFGEILVRHIIFIIAYVILVLFIPNVISKIDEATGAIISVLWILVSVLANWYALAFGITLYKQVKAVTDESKPAGMGWIKAVAVIGWLLALIGMVIGFSAAANLIRKAPGNFRPAPGSVLQQNMDRNIPVSPAVNDSGLNSL